MADWSNWKYLSPQARKLFYTLAAAKKVESHFFPWEKEEYEREAFFLAQQIIAKGIKNG